MSDFAVSRATVRKRLIVIFCFTVVITIILIGRLAWIQIVLADELYEEAWEQWNHYVPVQTTRGSIFDRHERLLVGSTTAKTVAALPPQIENPREVAAALSPVLEMEEDKILELITAERSAVYIKRKVEPQISEAVQQMGIPGIVFFDEEKRYYPGGNLASQLLGFVGMDQGWAGLEVYYEEYLSGYEGKLLYPADNRGRQVPHEFNRSLPPQQGYDLHLTVDETIQHIVEKHLDQIVVDSAPDLALAVAVDPHNGAVLAAASRPDYNPDAYDSYDPESWSLAPFTEAFEPGSTFKVVTLATAIEEGIYDPGEYFHCSGHVAVNGRQINCWTADRGGHGDITFYEAIGASCNPAFIELGTRIGAEKLLAYIEAFGYGRLTGIDYPGESSGLVFSPESFGPLELATTSFGQGIAVTPIQQAMAVAAMVNGGYLYRPYLVKEIRDSEGNVILNREPDMIRQVISAETSARLVDLMESVVLEGTGKTAAVEGFRVAGKTGTAEKVGPDNSYLSDQFVYSFVGTAPVEDPQIVLYVAVDGVSKGPRYGSYTSAPLFSRIIEDVMNYLQIPPSEPVIEEADLN